MTGDTFTVLHSVNGKYATKQFSQDKEGNIKNRSYGSEKFFRIESIAVANFRELCEALDQVAKDPYAFIIRGEPVPGINQAYTRRLLHPDPKTGDPATFAAVGRHWLLIDVDHVPAPPLTDPVTDPEGAIQAVIGMLPPELQDASVYWQFSSSQSLPGSENTLSVHLVYWSEVPYTDDELNRWAAAVNNTTRIIDPAVFRAVQPNYIASPLFRNFRDPLPRRSGVTVGLEDDIILVIPPPDPKHPQNIGTEGYAPGLGTQAYLAEIGGPLGVREPIKKAIASYIAINGSGADCEALKDEVRKAIDSADPGNRSAEQIARYKSDEHLDDLIAWVRKQHGDRPPKGFIPDEPDLGEEPPPPDDTTGLLHPLLRPVMRLAGGLSPFVLDKAEEVLIASDPYVYVFGDQVVRPAPRPIRIADEKTAIGLRLVPIAPAHMAERFTRCIEFQKFNSKKAIWYPVDCPVSIAGAYLERVGLWRLRQLAALTTCPLLLADGRILDKPGFDSESGILFDPQGVDFPPVPPHPTKKGAAEALDFLMKPFQDFPFVDGASKSVLRSLLLSAVSRFAYPFVPCHAFDAPAAGTGKSKLFNCAAILLTGRECEVVSQPEDEVEFEKKLFTLLLSGAAIACIDNCDFPLNSPFLCMTLTQRFVQSRILGLSKNAIVPNNCLFGANGNNFSYTGDMLRRGLTRHLNAGSDKPWEREFTSEDPIEVFKRDRPLYVAAALTVLRGYIANDRPRQKVPPLGGFEAWSLVRDALLWLGQDDPVKTIETAQKADPTQQKLETVVTQWIKVLKNESLTTRDIIKRACDGVFDPSSDKPNRIIYFHPEFRNALLDVAAEQNRVSPEKLGSWLGRNKLKVVRISEGHNTHDSQPLPQRGLTSYRLAPDTPLDGYGRWHLECHQPDGTWRAQPPE
jgi:hypothetical protein